MIGIDLLISQMPGVDLGDLQRWILSDWVRPEKEDGHYVFHAIDVARVRLIRDLLDDMKLNEEALPVVLVLLDQLYETRRRIREVGTAILSAGPRGDSVSTADVSGGSQSLICASPDGASADEFDVSRVRPYASHSNVLHDRK